MVIVDNSYLVKTRIEIGEYFGVPPADAFIELREPCTFDALKLDKAAKASDTGETLKVFSEILPRLVVDHNLYKDKDNKLDSDAVVAALAEKIDLFTHIVTVYSEKVLFTLGSKSAGKLTGSPEASSEAK